MARGQGSECEQRGVGRREGGDQEAWGGVRGARRRQGSHNREELPQQHPGRAWSAGGGGLRSQESVGGWGRSSSGAHGGRVLPGPRGLMQLPQGETLGREEAPGSEDSCG